MTREQLILWNYLRATFAPTATVPLFYQGVYAGSEFLTYAATKLYFALELAGSQGATTAAYQYLRLYNQLNALSFIAVNNVVLWNTTAAAINYVAQTLTLNNFYFGRILSADYTEIKFIGYRLTIPP